MADHTFCRMLYNETVKELREVKPDILTSKFWSYHFHRDHWEVQNDANYPVKLYWYGSADCSWSAKTAALGVLTERLREET